MDDEPQREQARPVPSDEHLRESADVLSILNTAVGVAGAVGGLGGMYYGRKSYLAQRDQAPEADFQRSAVYDPGFGQAPDYDPGFGGSTEYDPGFGEDIEY